MPHALAAAATLLMPGCAVATAPMATAPCAFESCVVAQGCRDHAVGDFGSRSTAMAQLASKLGPGQPPRPRVEIYRVAGGRLVEHWSVAP